MPALRIMSAFRKSIFSLVVGILALSALVPVARAGEDWLPILPDELKMTSEPKAPGAQAIYLYRQVDRNDEESREFFYSRIKIFTEEGRKYADIEIPFVKGSGDIKNVQARTIHPDGTIINFEGKPYEKMIVKAKGLKYLAKTFSMPDVQVGSIVEYRYARFTSDGWIYDSRWLLSEELFTKQAKFSLHRNHNYALQWSWPLGLPEGTAAPVENRGVVRLETQNVPAFQIEDYMPPQDEMKFRVDFMYTRNSEKDPDKFWKQESKDLFVTVDTFVDKHKAMEQAVSQVISSSDTPEQKLQKIYARCQKIHNTSFEREKTQQELNRAKLKEIRNVEDVWKTGYGDGQDITWLFLALARAAGFDASAILISTRDKHFFDPKLMKPDELNTNVVLVKLNGKDLYLDPGIAFAPYGLLPWYETGVLGLRLEKDGGTWVTTTMPEPFESGVERKATLKLDDSGSLEGKASVTFRGLAALWRRIDEHDEDDAQRKKFLEDEIKESIPVASEAELSNSPDWNSSSTTLVAEYDLKIPGWASAAGRRTLLAVGLFGGGEKHVFEQSSRIHPIYFDYPYSDLDDVTITPPSELAIASLPKGQNVDQKVCAYSLTSENKGGSLHLNRSLMVNLHLLDPKYYAALRAFFQTVRNGDEQQVMLSPVSAAGN